MYLLRIYQFLVAEFLILGKPQAIHKNLPEQKSGTKITTAQRNGIWLTASHRVGVTALLANVDRQIHLALFRPRQREALESRRANIIHSDICTHTLEANKGQRVFLIHPSNSELQ